MAEVWNRFGWTILSVLVLRSHLLTALTEVLENMTVTIAKTLVLNAQVTHSTLLLQNVNVEMVKIFNQSDNSV